MPIWIYSADIMRYVCNQSETLFLLLLNAFGHLASTQNVQETPRNLVSTNKIVDETIALREKRQLPLVYPYGGTYKLLIGIGVPIPNEDHLSLVFAANFQYQYVQYQNITQLSQYYSFLTVTRGQRALDDVSGRMDERMMFYKATEEMLSSKGFNGHECMLRAVCEAAQYSVEEEGLVGEIMHILLTPDYGRSHFQADSNSDYKDLMSEYLSAQRAGAQMFHCASVYDACPEGQGVMELISKLRDD